MSELQNINDGFLILRKKKSNCGMLLLEAIFAIVILITTLSVIIESLVSGLRATVFTADYSRALVLADQSMTELMRQRFIDANFQDEADFPAPDEQFHYEIKTKKLSENIFETKIGEHTSKNKTITVNDGGDDPEGLNGLNEIQLTVSWKSGRKEQSVSLVTWLPDVSEKKAPSEN